MKYRELTYGEVIKKSDKRKFFLWPASQRNLDRQRGIFAQLLWYYTMSDSYHSKNTPGNCCPSVHNSLDSQTYPHCTKPTARKLLQDFRLDMLTSRDESLKYQLRLKLPSLFSLYGVKCGIHSHSKTNMVKFVILLHTKIEFF